MLGSLILYLKGVRIMMFQLSGFYCMRTRMLGLGFLGLRMSEFRVHALGLFGLRGFGLDTILGPTQTFQNPLIKEYTLNHLRDPTRV